MKKNLPFVTSFIYLRTKNDYQKMALSRLHTGQPCSNAYRAWSIKNRNS